MKKLFLIAATLLLSAAASAQTVPTQFKDSSSNSFDVTNLRSIECVSSTSYKLTHTAESFGLTYPDTTGACAKAVASAFGQANFIQVPGTNRYLNAQQARRVYMDGSQTKIIWNAGPEEYFSGSGVHAAFLAKSN